MDIQHGNDCEYAAGSHRAWREWRGRLYFSGNGQYSGFIYSDEMKGERGKAIFVFTNDKGNMLLSEKEIQLK